MSLVPYAKRLPARRTYVSTQTAMAPSRRSRAVGGKFKPGAQTIPRSAWGSSRVAPFDSMCTKLMETVSVSATTGLIRYARAYSDLTAAANWGPLSNVYDGFILHGMRVEWTFNGVSSGSAFPLGSVTTGVDLDSPVAPIDVPSAQQFSSSMLVPSTLGTQNKHTRTVWIPSNRRPLVNTIAGFNTTVNSNGCIWMLADLFPLVPPSEIKYIAKTTWFVQFFSTK